MFRRIGPRRARPSRRTHAPLRTLLAGGLCAGLGLWTHAGALAQAPGRPPAESAVAVANPVDALVFDRFADALAAAERIARADALAAARSATLDARASAAGGWFAGPPTVGVDLRRDLPPGFPQPEPSPERGRNEWDYGVSVPLWLPGERDLRRAGIGADRELADAERLSRRLELAGRVRDASWAVRRARAEADAAERRHDGAQRLQADLERRVRAGEVARADLLLASEETLAAAAELAQARQAMARARADLVRLTGRPEPPRDLDAAEAALAASAPHGGPVAAPVARPVALSDWPPPAAASAPAPSHPRLALAERRVAAARAQLELASRLRRDNPTAAVVIRNDRDTYGADYRNTVRVGVSLPLDTEARNAPRIALASEALLEAQARLDEEARRVAYETEVARAEAATMSGQVDFARQRVAAASDALALVERAHALGERALAEVLRMRAVVRAAEAALRSATIGRDAARSALNQSLGLMP